MIALESASKRYGASTVVRDLSFTVEKGEIVGFLGPNGAGKTTTLRMVAGYLTASSGRVTVAGHDMARGRAAAAHLIGYLPERPPLYDTLDVRGYLRFVAKAKGVPRAALAGEVDRVCGACRLEAVFQRGIYQLSKGYRQRVGLAQALLGQPQVLLLDEPTIGLDPGQIHQTRELIRAFGGSRAVLLSTHLLAEATQLCQRIAIIDRGRLLAIDSPSGLERAIGRSHQVSLRIGGPETGLRETLEEIPGVGAVRIEHRPDRRLEVTCEVAQSDEVEAAIARAVVRGTGRSRGWELHRLVRQEPSLESVFLRYVRGEREGEHAP